MNIRETIKSALYHYQAGDIQKAERLFRIVLRDQPDNAEILYLLGTIYGHTGKYDSAIRYIERSLQLNPANAEAYCALGIAMQHKGLLDQAIECFRKTLTLDPAHDEARNSLGNALIEKGNAFRERGLFDEAITRYQKALEANPTPAGADILYHNLGMSFQAKGTFDDAIDCYRKAVHLNPRLIAAHNNMGIVLQKAGRFHEAAECYQKALQIDPRSAPTYYLLGILLQGQGRNSEAATAYATALNIEPDYPAARWAMAICQLPIVYPDQAGIETARERYRKELTDLSESVSLRTPQDIMASVAAVGTQQPFHLPYQGLNDRELQGVYGNLVHRIMSAGYPQFSDRPVMPPSNRDEPLRIGIVSGHFHSHPVWNILAKGWIANLNKSKFRLHGYYTGRISDGETDFARRNCARFIENIYSFEALCTAIADDRLHAIIYPEIGMDPTTLRLAALRLAPLQCASWGHPDTSGLPTIDYFLSADLMEPEDGQNAYTERLVRLPGLSIFYEPPAFPEIRVSRETYGLRMGSVLYHCCQTLFKFLPQYDEIFPRIAQRVADCQFIFSSLPELDAVTSLFRKRMERTFERFQLHADDHVVFMPHLNPLQYHALNRLCDVFLDPIGWSGCTSVLEAIDCNLPVIASPSRLMRGRESGAILTMMGMTETLAASVDDYTDLAIRLGNQPEQRNRIARAIALNKHKIYRDYNCIRGLEAFLLRAVEDRVT